MMTTFLLIGLAVLVVILFGEVSALKKRLSALERSRSAPIPPQQQRPVQANQTTPSPAPAQPAITPPARTAPIPAATTPAPKEPSLAEEWIRFLFAWLRENWFYAISGASLALAGIFLVQYGVEQGLLPPAARIAAALFLGVALVAGGEFVLRRFGDSQSSTTAYLPSTLSSAGMITLFGAIVAARGLYGLISPEFAFAGLSFVGMSAILLGWRYGPLLSGIGIIGAFAVPFVVGGSSENPSWLLGYFLIITLTGLGIDALQRWAWITVLSLVLAFAASALVALGSGPITFVPLQLTVLVFAASAIAIPRLEPLPRHEGAHFLLNLFFLEKEEKTEFPTTIAGLSVLAACGFITATVLADQQSFWTGVALLAIAAIGLTIWLKQAHALLILPIMPWVALGLCIPLGIGIWEQDVSAWRGPDGTLPLSVTIFVGIGVAISLAAAWRSFASPVSRKTERYVFAAFAALAAPALAILLEIFWHPAEAFADYGWALHALVLAIIMMGLAERFHKADGYDDRLRVSFAALSGLTAIAFATVILFSQAALTAALSFTIVTAALLDRRFTLPPMEAYVTLGALVIMGRLVVTPGILWALEAPIWEVLLSHGGALAAFVASWFVLRGAARDRAQVVLDSAAFSAAGLLLSLLLYRAIEYASGIDEVVSHWALGLGACIWIALGIAQLRRRQLGGKLAAIRTVLASAFLVLGGAAVFAALSVANPVLHSGETVLGPIVLSSLIPAYLLPAVITLLGVRLLSQSAKELRIAMTIPAIALIAIWVGLTIRHAWQDGAGMAEPFVGQGELYSYTLALLLLGAGLFYRSITTSDALLRKAGLITIGLAIAKVFLVDISGLDGLTRVFSLLILGLSLAGLAWLNRWAAQQSSSGQD